MRAARIFLGDDLGHAALVRGIGVGVQQADTDRLDALRAKEPRRGARVRFVERAQLLGRENRAGRRPRARSAAARCAPASPRNTNCRSPRAPAWRAISRIWLKPSVTMRPRPAISPCSSALVATVVPCASPARSSNEAPPASRMALTPRTRPMAGLEGVLATLVTRIAPERAVDTDDIGEGAAGVDADPKMGASLRHVATPRMRSPSADPAGLGPGLQVWAGRARPKSKTD